MMMMHKAAVDDPDPSRAARDADDGWHVCLTSRLRACDESRSEAPASCGEEGPRVANANLSALMHVKGQHVNVDVSHVCRSCEVC